LVRGGVVREHLRREFDLLQRHQAQALLRADIRAAAAQDALRVASTNTFRYEIATANAGCRMDRTEVQSARTRSGAKVKKRSNVFTIGPERIKKPLNPTR
jgi:hypothetical protein